MAPLRAVLTASSGSFYRSADSLLGFLAHARAVDRYIDVRPSVLLIDARIGTYYPHLLYELATQLQKNDPSGGTES